MTEFQVFIEGICLDVFFEDKERDCYHPELGHYTIPDHFYIEAVMHQGYDIMPLLAESVLNDIYKAYDKESKEKALP